MNRHLFVFLIFAASVIMPAPACLSAQSFETGSFATSGYSVTGIYDMTSAMELCSGLPLSPIEGIWEYPDDDVSMLILRDKWKKGHYNVYVLDAVDCRLTPGIKIGQATESADPRQFKLALCSKIKRSLPGAAVNCLAKLDKENTALMIAAPDVKLSFTPSIMLPTLWNRLRLSLRLRVNNPVEKLPEGWRKVYPSYDGNGSSPTSPRYL